MTRAFPTSRFDPSRGAAGAAGPSFAESLATALGGGLVRVFDGLFAWQQRAADRRALLALDDHLLRDIGLSRADIEAEAGKPFWRG